MKALLLPVFVFLFCFPVFAQEEDYDDYQDETEDANQLPNEFAFDLNFSASNFGGTGGVGLKLGFPINEHVIAGPSVRYQQTWAFNGGLKTNFAVYGGGGFLHYRFFDYLFLGTEVEFLSTPIKYTYISNDRSFVPVVLVGGGFSYAFTDNFRLNAGIMYDLVNHVNSPLRQGYFLRNSQNVYQPVIYRIAFFFPI